MRIRQIQVAGIVMLALVVLLAWLGWQGSTPADPAQTQQTGGIVNPLEPSASNRAAGQRLYTANCVLCHGPTGRGDGPAAATLSPRPLDFRDTMRPGIRTDAQIFLWIKHGYPGTAMPATPLPDTELWQIVVYLRSMEF